MRRLLFATCALLAACGQSTELMLIVKATPGLSFGLGGDIDTLRVSVQPATDDPKVFTFTRSIELCGLTEQGSPDCRPQRYAAEDYDKALTLPIRLLLEPGTLGQDQDVRVWIDGLVGSKVQISDGLRFRFAPERRLWLEVPLYHDCIGITSCQPNDQICGIDKQCADARPTEQAPPEDRTEPNDLSGILTAPDAAQACGALAMQCCNGQACQPTLSCNTNGYCINPSVTCGQDGQACCAGAVCTGGLMCASGTCVSACGDTGQACCLGGACNKGGDKCIGGTCTPCGSSGQVCCPGAPDPYCNGSTVCSGVSGQCVSCGSIGELCCANDVCFVGACGTGGTAPDFGGSSGDLAMSSDMSLTVSDSGITFDDMLTANSLGPSGTPSGTTKTCQ